MLKPLQRSGISLLYLDDRVEMKGHLVSEADGDIWEDTVIGTNRSGVGPHQQPKGIDGLKAAYNATMERLYDEIVRAGGFAWQMFFAGPNSLMRDNGMTIINGTVDPWSVQNCTDTLRYEYCVPNGTQTKRALLYTNNVLPNATAGGEFTEQYLALFLLSRGPWAWIGWDCK
eukprot:SAG31_NODE_530_length_14420_cov_4.259968_12_plen_172_part_00